MPRKQIELEGIGQVTLAKRRGSSSLRLSVKPDRRIWLSMPYWTPYLAGERFVVNRRHWIKQQLANLPQSYLEHGDGIGKNHRLYFKADDSVRRRDRISQTEILIYGPKDTASKYMQAKALAACEKALKMQSEQLLNYRIRDFSRKYDLKYETLKFRKLTSRWGSCTSQKVITLNIYLIQLPWHLIDYVLVHELVHLKHLDHSPDFWDLLIQLSPNAKALRREMKQYHPSIMPVKTSVVA